MMLKTIGDGWYEVFSAGDGRTDQGMSVWWKIATGAAPTISIPTNRFGVNSSFGQMLWYFVIKGNDTVSPIVDWNYTHFRTSAGSYVPAALTVNDTKTFGMSFFAADNSLRPIPTAAGNGWTQGGNSRNSSSYPMGAWAYKDLNTGSNAKPTYTVGGTDTGTELAVAIRANKGDSLPTFDSIVSAQNPVAWYDFESTWGASLNDKSGNGRHLTRVGSNTPPTAAAFRTTTTQSMNFSTYDSRTNYYDDSVNALTSFISGKGGEAISNEITDYGDYGCTVTMSLKKDSASLFWQKFCGMSASATNTLFSIHSAYGGGGLTSLIETRHTEAAQSTTSHYMSVSKADTDVHIITWLFFGGKGWLFVDGEKVAINNGYMTSTDDSKLVTRTLPFQLGGTFSSATAGTFRTDHLHITDKALAETDIRNMHLAYMAELI
jgi:hypothetical protein